MWPFKKNVVKESEIGDILQPPEEFILNVVNGVTKVHYLIPRQYVNWANKQVGVDVIHQYGDLITVKSVGILYIACVNYLERSKNASA